MKKYCFNFICLTLVALVVGLVSCNDEWDDHYSPEIVGKSSMTTYQYIASRDDMSTFRRMLEISGYDSLLNTAQTYTVWVPTNNSLNGLDLEDTLTVQRIVKNHITFYSKPTASIVSKPIKMVNSKLLPFQKVTPGFSFGGKTVVESDIAMSNGIVHVLDNYVPYLLNVWEYLNETEGLDSVRNYIQSLTRKVYDPAASFNSDGVFVDSVFFDYNPVLSYLCDMNNEDSTYTAIFPDNNAWDEMYSRVFPCYNTLPISGGAATQAAYTKSTIVTNLFFSGKLEYPVPGNKKYLTTFGDTITNINEVLEGIPMNSLSNGMAYRTSYLNYKSSDVYHKPIRVEAESIVGIDSLKSNYALSIVSSVGTNMSASNNRFITAVPTSSSSISKLFVRFPIPNTLSAKYNIYCVFVPTAIMDTTDLRPYKANFYITYKGSNGKTIKDSKLTVTNNITDPRKMTKMLVAQNFTFPFCNILNEETEPVASVLLKVENATGTRETATYNRTIRIDCILLEPVQ